MRKKTKIKNHPVEPDNNYNSLIVARLINKIMCGGKKDKARGIVYQALQIIEKNLKNPPVDVLEKASENLEPELELKSQKRGGVKLQVPHEISANRKKIISLYWLVTATRERKKKEVKPMFQRLAEEITNAYNKTGEAYKKKENMHKMAIANLAFAYNLRK